jgi:hypothetical protein
VVLRDLVVMLADGGGCLADLGAVRDQVDLYGHVASDSTAFRVIDSIDEQRLDGLRGAVAVSRARAWKLGARPERCVARWHSRSKRTVLDIDATLTTVHSEQEQAHGNFKGGYGHHRLLCYLDGTGEAPAGILRAGNAGSNTAADHQQVLDLALGQLDPQALQGEILVRADGAGATHELTEYCQEAGILFSFGFDLSAPVHAAIVARPEHAWVNAIRVDGSEREHSQVVEITDHVDISSWSERSPPTPRPPSARQRRRGYASLQCWAPVIDGARIPNGKAASGRAWDRVRALDAPPRARGFAFRSGCSSRRSQYIQTTRNTRANCRRRRVVTSAGDGSRKSSQAAHRRGLRRRPLLTSMVASRLARQTKRSNENSYARRRLARLVHSRETSTPGR